jgi:hypothetical protein
MTNGSSAAIAKEQELVFHLANVTLFSTERAVRFPGFSTRSYSKDLKQRKKITSVTLNIGAMISFDDKVSLFVSVHTSFPVKKCQHEYEIR